MCSQRSYKHKERPSAEQTPQDVPSKSDDLGGWSWLRHPAAAFSSQCKDLGEELVHRIEGIKIEIPFESMANDNNHKKQKMHFAARVALVVIGAGVMGFAFFMNESKIATQIVLNADDQMLETAMDTNPEALAYLLNAMDVGEQ